MNEQGITRRTFVEGSAALVAAGAIAGGATAALAAEKPQLVDGKYVVETIGHEGKMTVVTTIADGKIAAVSVPSYRETQGVGTFAIQRIPAAIVEAQSIDVDVVVGATITSVMIQNGVSEAIEQAGGDAMDYWNAPQAPEPTPKVADLDVDVAIMGAGTAGLFCAFWLLQQGVDPARIALFEKQDIPGGCMAMTYGGIVMSGSKIYNTWCEINGVKLPAGEAAAYNTWEEALEFYSGIVSGYNPDFNPQMPYTRQMFERSGELYDYMSGIGMGFTPINMTPFYNYPYFAPGCYAGGSGFAMEFLVNLLTNRGVQIYYGAPVTAVTSTAEGVVTGLVAEGKDGTLYRCAAGSVVLASGSFAKNRELVAQYYPELADAFFNCPAGLTGDGLKIGMGLGAGIECMGEFLPGFLATYDTHFELAFMHFSTPGIIVNVNGDQFGNIMVANHALMSAAKADPANQDTFYYIFDDDSAASTRDYKGFNFTTYSGIFEKGEAMRFDSVEACVEALGLANLPQTIATNNAHAAAGEADEWGRAGLPYIETRNGVWALRVDPNYYLTTGGLKIDLDGRVLTPEGAAIPNLYAAGDVCGSVEAKDGRHYDFGFNAAMTYGTIAADAVIKDHQA